MRNMFYMISRDGRSEVEFDFTLDAQVLLQWTLCTGLADSRLVHSLDSGRDVTRYQEPRITDTCDHQGFLSECMQCLALLRPTVEKHSDRTSHVELTHSRDAPFTGESPQRPPC